jgi:hypothetical protein
MSELVITEFTHGPEPIRVVEDDLDGRPIYLVQAKSPVHGRWITMSERRDRDQAIAEAEEWYPRAGAAEGRGSVRSPGEAEVRPSEWNIVIRKYSPSRWSYTVHTPQGGSFSTTAFTTAKSALRQALSGGYDFNRLSRWGGADSVWTIREVWDRASGDYVVTGTGWTDVATGQTEWEASGARAAEVYDEPGQWYRLVEIDDGSAAGLRYVQITDEDDDALVGLADADGEAVDLGNVSWTAIGRRTHDFDRAAAGIERQRAAAEGAAERLDEHGPLRTFWVLTDYEAGPFASREEAEAERARLIAEGAKNADMSEAEFEAGMGFPGRRRFLEVVPIEREIWVTDADPRYDYEGYNFQVGEEGSLRVMALDPERTWYQVNRYASGMYFISPYGSDNHKYYAEHPPARRRR